jgi:hypothetical protein
VVLLNKYLTETWVFGIIYIYIYIYDYMYHKIGYKIL